MSIPKQHFRKILHMDLDAFFCAVEELSHPELRNTSFAVGGDPGERGVVSSCSYAARQKGIHSAMPMAQAVRLDPQLIIIHTNHKKYAQLSAQVMQILGDYTALIEQISIDEAFLDISDLADDPYSVAIRIQKQIKSMLLLPSSFGVASNKLLAKMANDYGKKQHHGAGYPEKITVIKNGEEKAFLAPLPVERLWGVGDKTRILLKNIGVQKIGQLAACDPKLLNTYFGKYGADLHRHANGIDDRPVESYQERKSLSQEITFSKDVSSEKSLRKAFLKICEEIGKNLRHENLCALTIRVKYRYADFSTFTRQTTLDEPTFKDLIVFNRAWELFLSAWDKNRSIRLIGVGVSKFSDYFHQPSLFVQENKKDEKLLEAMDQLKNKYGNDIIQRAAFINVAKNKENKE